MRYTIGDIEEIVGVKVHVIRYWEQEIAMLRPRRDNAGRRVYSGRDVQMLLRLKHLLYDRHFTIAGARHQLFLELSGRDQGIHAQIAELRMELLALYRTVHSMGTKKIP
jgi:DNA-binding transcriptional MerR regulator